MKIPNADRAMIDEHKLVDYLLNIEHKRGGSKARLLIQLGYNQHNAQRLRNDLRQQHLRLNVQETKETPFGMQYVVAGPLRTPSGRIRLFRSVWQIDKGAEYPRLITAYPE